MTDVARGMKIKTIAEYVESEDTLKLLKEYRVNYAQGFHIGKPMPPQELNAL
jgi:EAL domain-containing protein (putative c-di-GMP-specific phosphodiesterase class I)